MRPASQTPSPRPPPLGTGDNEPSANRDIAPDVETSEVFKTSDV